MTGRRLIEDSPPRLRVSRVGQQRGDERGARGGEGSARGPDVKGGDMAVAHVLFVHRVERRLFEREGGFDEAAAGHGAGRGLRFVIEQFLHFRGEFSGVLELLLDPGDSHALRLTVSDTIAQSDDAIDALTDPALNEGLQFSGAVRIERTDESEDFLGLRASSSPESLTHESRDTRVGSSFGITQ